MVGYQALYRVFRPQRFGDLIGQDHISRTLRNALVHDRLAHAYLFCGPRGTGKTSSAKILAKAVNCLDLQEGEPCNACANCLAIDQEAMLDVSEIDAASNRGIDEMRDLKERVRFAPSQGKCKVYIIDEVHMLTTEAFNALLKTLEEPPAHVLFILATTDPQKIPMTVLSRTQRFDFHPIPAKAIFDHLKVIASGEGVAYEEAALWLIARKSAGGMRDAISTLDQCIAFAEGPLTAQGVRRLLGSVDETTLAELIEAIMTQDYQHIFANLSESLAQGADAKEILRDVATYLRNVLLLVASKDQTTVELAAEVLPKAQSQGARLGVGKLGRMLSRLGEAERDIRFSAAPRLVLEVALLDLSLPEAAVPVANVAATPVPAAMPTPVQKVAKPPSPKRKLVAPADLTRAWEEVMEQVKKVSVRIHAFLKPAQVLGLEQDVLVIRYDQTGDFHFHQMENKENSRILTDVLREMAGTPIQVRFELAQGDGEAAEDFDIVQEAIKLFGADKVVVVDE